jgi:hypothetical protein
MSLSFLLGTIIAVGSLISMGGRMDTESLAAAPLSLPTILVSCLDPLAILLEIVAIVLIVLDGKKVGNPHRRLAWIAAIFFVLWGVLNLGVFAPVSLMGMLRGSLGLVKTGQMVKAGAALLQYAIPFVLVYGVSDKTPRVLLWLGLVLTIVGNFGVVTLPIGSIELKAIETAGRELYAPRFNVDYTSGYYPVLLGMGYVGGALYMIAYGYLAARFFRRDQPG